MLNKVPQSGRMAHTEALVCHRTGKPVGWLDPHSASAVDARYGRTQAVYLDSEGSGASWSRKKRIVADAA